MSYSLCPECDQKMINYWCQPCNSKHFQNDFNNWTSGNDKIDKFIQDSQLNAIMDWEVIEWIPYNQFKKDVKQIDKGGFGTIHYSKWVRSIKELDIENQQWKRDEQKEVVLKKFDNFVNFNNVLNEMVIHLKIWIELASIQFYGITQDPETHSYMMVLQYAEDENLREYLKKNFNNINWLQKLKSLYILSVRLLRIYELGIVHQDFHPGNILSSDFKKTIWISDFGLNKLIEINPNNPKKNNIFGVLPYIAPEVLSGGEKYTKASDVYSYGIIAYEIVTGFPPYPDISHDQDLTMKICNRPPFEELRDELRKYTNWYSAYLDKGKYKDLEIVIQIKKADEFSANQESTNMTATTTITTTTPLNYQTHLQEIYTSQIHSWVLEHLNN
ncbi:hypothetical protein Glove_29g158 [Diversispora epigaea]|uniref:Protein kinase domain-containing protein n=1 Tax=Diversispora epigaea TaxID=1348612 RepID=A0A397JKQ9_9GLOM|nr:hypothetical protein Glove_29g158 [Diversispora epigaea]